MSEKNVCEERTGKQKAPQKKCPRKPQYSYISLVTMAILDSPERKRTLGDIIEYIQAKFPFYGEGCPVKGWQNSIRHNLSLNDCFIKTHRDPAKPSRGHFWTLHPRSMDMFEGGSFMRRKKRFNAPDTQLRKGLLLPAEKLTSDAFTQDMMPLRRKREQQLNSSSDVMARETVPSLQDQLQYGLSFPAQKLPPSEMSDYVGPVMSRSMVLAPGWTPLGGTLSTHLGQPQYLFWTPEQNLIRSEMAHWRYGCPQCSGCTCDY